MKTNYLLSSSNRKKKIFGGIIFTLLIVILAFFFGTPLLSAGSAGFHYLAAIVWRGGNIIPSLFAPYKTFFQSKTALEKENEILRTERDKLNSELFLYPFLLEENKELKQILGRTEGKKVILSAILARPNRSPYDTLIIDSGLSLGVVEGDMVLAHGTTAIGTVVESYTRSAKVKLFSSPGNMFDVLIGTSSVAAIAKGEGAGNFSVTLPRDVPLSLGDAVAVPSLNILLFGAIGNIKNEAKDSFQTIRFRSPVNITELRWVEVVLEDNLQTTTSAQ